MNKRIAFADEYGNNSFKFDTQGSHFVVATVICKPENVIKLETEIDKIRKKHKFQTGELKSNKVGKNHERRIRILKDIAKLEFSLYAVIIDKRKLKGKGFHYKKSFYKYLNNLLYKELFRTFPRLELYVDEYGGSDYMLEFKKYVKKHHQKNLFSGSEFDILDSKESKLIQLADFIAGTLGHVFDESKQTEHSNTYLEIIKPLISDLNPFPKEYSFKDIEESNTDENFDPLIAKVCLMRINDFIEKTKTLDQQKTDQVNFLKLLLLFQRVYFKSTYISTNEIFKHLDKSRDGNLQKEYFRSKVVGALRDKGILISSSRTGYKIPTNKKDLESFIKHGNRMILPMLSRIEKMRGAIKLATDNELDLLDEFEELKKLMQLKNLR